MFEFRPMIRAFSVAAALCAAWSVSAAEFTVEPVTITDWKAVYGRVETRDRVPARARLGGTLSMLDVAAGDRVQSGANLARVVDQKLDYELGAVDARLQAAESRLQNAETELRRAEELQERGVATVQRLDALRTEVNVITYEIAAARAERRVIEQQVTEGDVLAPLDGVVLDVPVTAGAVVTPGQTIASIGGGGVFLRLAVPERHAGTLVEGDEIQIEGPNGPRTGTLAKVYPLIENGRVIADVEVDGLSERYVDARVLVRLPVGEHQALLVPKSALMTRAGLDFLHVAKGDETLMRSVVVGSEHDRDGVAMVRILTGLNAGDVVVTGDE